MQERIIHLRIKVKSLAAEAGIIRAESRKTREMVKWRLNEHRKTVVRDHTRHNILAYGLLRGRTYSEMEKSCREEPDWNRVANIAKRFGGDEGHIASWLADAKGEDPQPMLKAV